MAEFIVNGEKVKLGQKNAQGQYNAARIGEEITTFLVRPFSTAAVGLLLTLIRQHGNRMGKIRPKLTLRALRIWVNGAFNNPTNGEAPL